MRTPIQPQVSRTTLSPSKVCLAGSLILLGYAAMGSARQAAKLTSSVEASNTFEVKIRPVLDAKCVSCHGTKQHLGGVRLDKGISADLTVRLVEAIGYSGEVKMPPSGKLPPDELGALTAWAKAGAPWPAHPNLPPKSKAQLWSFLAPKESKAPKVHAAWWAQNPIDKFVLAKLEEKGLTPAPPADRRTLIRRATFDLTGLPPTPSEVDAFLEDKAPNAFEHVVDRLLASSAYGEKWGRHWLDVARYADSNGLDENLVYPNAWRYRDYVISALNADKPINRFFQEQLAGDLLQGAGDDGIIATGYLALGAKMLAEDDPVKQELDVIDEQIDTTTKTYLGLTVGCARCHDHKFDPIPTKDYYSLAGIFKSTKTMLNYKNMAEWNEQPLGSKADQTKLAEIETKVRSITESLNKKRDAAGEAFLKEIKPKTPLYEKAARQLLAAESKKAELHPVLVSRSGSLPSGSVEQEAEDYISGNVIKDKDGFGKGIGVLVNRGEYPNLAEYDVDVSADGSYQLDIRYASGDARPSKVFANGILVLGNAASEITGGFNPDHQKWFAEGVLSLHAGRNRIKFERESYFPHIDKFLLIPRPGLPPTASVESIAKESNLIPDVIRGVAEKIKGGGDPIIELPDKPDSLFSASLATELKGLEDEIAALQKSKPPLPRAMAVGEGKPTNLKVHIRGNYLTLGDECARGFPSAITDRNHSAIPSDHSGRLEFANWLTDARNPLTARVFVNRIWRWRFGRGIVASVDNFGTLGDLPTHPELLDYLATSFIKQDGWSLKKLHKRMMLTNTYLMSGKYNTKAASIDPDNHYLWRFPRQRLEAESIRDSILFVSGTLDRKMGGTTITLPPRSYVTSTNNSDPVNYSSLRRAVYLPVIRSAVYDVYTAFDFGDPTVMNGDRSSTTVAPQALFMLNSSVVLGASKAQATTLLKRSDVTDEQRVRELYLTCYGRPAKQEEVVRALKFVARIQLAYSKAKDPRLNAWQSLCKALIGANEFIYVE